MAKNSMEHRAKAMYGATTVPEHAGYILPDGTMLNFSFEGRQRDVDHREIGEFFSNADGTDAMNKFIRRGNIRCSCSECGYGFEFVKTPTKEQWETLKKVYVLSVIKEISFFIERMYNGKYVVYSFEELEKWLAKRNDYLLY